VHVAAPGVQVYSTIRDGGYKAYSGTSMACPHVSGIAALMMANDSRLDYAEVKKRLITTSVPMPTLRSKSASNGMVSAFNAVYNVVPPKDGPDDSQWKTRSYDVESNHPYDTNSNVNFEVKVPGAKYIRVIFERVGMERGYDKLYVKDASGAVAEELTGNLRDYTSEHVKGDTLVLNLVSDRTVNDYGFSVKQILIIE
jgi:subtilisin family serine protease